jgi:hypothetical protein
LQYTSGRVEDLSKLFRLKSPAVETHNMFATIKKSRRLASQSARAGIAAGIITSLLATVSVGADVVFRY